MHTMLAELKRGCICSVMLSAKFSFQPRQCRAQCIWGAAEQTCLARWVARVVSMDPAPLPSSSTLHIFDTTQRLSSCQYYIRFHSLRQRYDAPLLVRQRPVFIFFSVQRHIVTSASSSWIVIMDCQWQFVIMDCPHGWWDISGTNNSCSKFLLHHQCSWEQLIQFRKPRQLVQKN